MGKVFQAQEKYSLLRKLHWLGLDLLMEAQNTLIHKRTLWREEVKSKATSVLHIFLAQFYWIECWIIFNTAFLMRNMKVKTGRTTPKMKQYKVTPIAHTSRAYRNMMLTWLNQKLTAIRTSYFRKKKDLLTFPEKFLRVSERVSGARNAGVPTVLVSRASAPSNWLLTPKSAILTWPSSPTSRLEGLMSRWMIFW